MINLNNAHYIAYTTREFVNVGLRKKDTLYRVMFTPQDNALIRSGSIVLLPYEMCDFYTPYDITLKGKVYNKNDKVNPEDFEFNTLRVLLKANSVKFNIKDEIKELSEEDIVKLAKTYKSVGLTFKRFSEMFNIDFAKVKEAFDLKQGGQNKKITKEDLDMIKELI